MSTFLLIAALGLASQPAPPCESARECLAKALVDTRDPGPCLEIMAFATERWPDDPEIAHRQATCLFAGGRSEEALPLLERCVAGHPGFHLCQFFLGTLLKMLSRYDDAVAPFESALALEAARGEVSFHTLIALGELYLVHEDVPGVGRLVDLGWTAARTAEEVAQVHSLALPLAMLEQDGDRALEHLAGAAPDIVSRGGSEAVSRAFILAWMGRFEEAAAVAEEALARSDTPKSDQHRQRFMLLSRVIRRSMPRSTLEEIAQATRGEYHRAWFLLALDAHLAGNPEKVCADLEAGHQTRNKLLMHPLWAPDCRPPSCALPGRTP